MKKTIKFLWYGENNIINVIVNLLIIFLLILQFTYMVSSLEKNKDNYGIISATDLDAGRCIAAAVDARWYNFHDTYGYGVLYYRLGNSIESFIVNSGSLEQNNKEKTEERIHFSLTLISLISLFGLSILIAHVIFNEIKLKLLGILIINASFFNTDIWINYVFRAHPDLLLSVLTALFIYTLYKSKYDKSIGLYYLSAFFAAAALSSKQTFIIFLPGLIFIEIPPIQKERLIRLINYLLVFSVSYFFIGFPQNFRIDQNVSFLLRASNLFYPPTLESFTQWWLLLFEQSYIPLITIIILYLLFGRLK